MKRYCFLLASLIVFGLHTATACTPRYYTIPQEKYKPADTTITYTIDGVGGEGAEAVARYVKGRIKTCNVRVFGENGQSRIRYQFSKGRIDVTEQQYSYKGNLESVSHKEDMQLKKTIHYTTDMLGKPAAKADKDRTDVFTEFTDAVPFELE